MLPAFSLQLSFQTGGSGHCLMARAGGMLFFVKKVFKMFAESK
jgi:hypothetical protein